MLLQELSAEIDSNHDSYMEFTEQTLESPDLMKRLVTGLTTHEKHLVELELMIIEQVLQNRLVDGEKECSILVGINFRLPIGKWAPERWTPPELVSFLCFDKIDNQQILYSSSRVEPHQADGGAPP